VGSQRRGMRERTRATDKRSEGQSIGQKWKWRKSEMAVSEIVHLNIFINANQNNQ
jgi:hypothetical protein